jgi:hypothetical protein
VGFVQGKGIEGGIFIMKMKVIFILFKVCIVLLLTSCVTVRNLGKIRNDILNIDPNIEKVGFIPNSTGTDDKYISIEIIFSDGRCLYLKLVNYANRLTPNDPFWLSRIGNYSFCLFSNHLNENQEVKLFTNENGRKWYERTRVRNEIPIRMIADDIGIKFLNNNGNIRNLSILINNYDKILSYVESLPEYNESLGDVFFDSLHMFTPIKSRISSDLNYIITRTNWDDKYYHWERRPDYEITNSYAIIK